MIERPPADAPAVGIDGCRGGWVAVRLVGSGLTWTTAPVDRIDLLVGPDAVAGIDIPIGLAEHGLRDCDSLARAALPGAASRVFTTPPRAVIELGPAAPNSEVQEVSRRLSGRGVSRQALHLAPRILAVDALLARSPGLAVVEVHPELSFAALAGRVLSRKKGDAGVAERIGALRGWLPGVDGVVAARPRGVPIDDALDALAALWSAVRWRDGLARTLPDGARTRPFIAV